MYVRAVLGALLLLMSSHFYPCTPLTFFSFPSIHQHTHRRPQALIQQDESILREALAASSLTIIEDRIKVIICRYT